MKQISWKVPVLYECEARPKEVFNQLLMLSSLDKYNGQRLEYYRQNGISIPDELKPGALLNRLTADQREALKRLDSETLSKLRPNTFCL